MTRVAAILPAAGSSSRFGRDKRLVPWHGRTLLRRAAEALVEVASPVVVVLPPRDEAGRRELLRLPVVIVENPDPARGLGSSLATGAQRLAGRSGFDRVLVALVDQPRMDPSLLELLVIEAGTAGWAACDYGGGDWGVPACLPAAALAELVKLAGDHGAREILRPRFEEGELPLVPFPGGRDDVDTPADYAGLSGESGG